MKKRRSIVLTMFIMVFAFCFVKSSVYATELPRTITGFEDFDINENALHLVIEYKPALNEVVEMMPDTLGVYLDEGTEVEYIEVDWFCVAEDYENSDNFYFQFSPQWDENEYVLSEEILLLTDAPYIGVFFTTEDQAISTFAVTNNSNEEKIFEYLTGVAGYSPAAACGIMANIYCESAFIPINLENFYESKLGYNDASYTQAVDSGKYKNFVRDAAGYGLCQWTYWTRKQELLNYAKSAGKSIGDLTMQLGFLKKELSGSALDDYIEDVPNTNQGAYKVGYYFCEKYENPAQTADEKSVYRGNLAKNTYWPEYYDKMVDYTIRISGQNAPGTIAKGGTFRISGVLDCNVNITNISLGIYDFSGVKRGGNNFNPNSKTYDLSVQNPMMGFDKLEPGVYVYQISASNVKRTYHLIDQKFIVLADSKTVSDGRYMIESRGTSTLVADVADHSNASRANIELAYKKNTMYQFFDIKHVGGGYYTIRNCGSGMYLDVTNGAAADRTNVQQKIYDGGTAQKWQILILGDSYCFVPHCANAYCLDIQNAGTAEGTNLQICKANLQTAQKFKLIRGEIHEIFKDVTKGSWFYDDVKYVYKNDLMTGYAAEGLFKPNQYVTRAQIVTTLYRMEGEPKVTDYKACNEFSDVERDQYYTDAVCWAFNQGIATGNKVAKKFNTSDKVTREQLATFLFRYAEYKGNDVETRAEIEHLLNSEKVSSYALEAVQWAVGTGLIEGRKTTNVNGIEVYDLDPAGNATRAQLAAILTRFYSNQ